MAGPAMKNSAVKVICLALILCACSIQAQNVSNPAQPQISDYMKLMTEGLQALNKVIPKGVLQQLTKFASQIPNLNQQNLMGVLQALNITIPSQSELNGILQFLGNTMTSSTPQNNKGPAQDPFAEARKWYGYLGPRCRASLGLLGSELTAQKQWALRMIDAMGKPQEGIMNGNTHWRGSYDECIKIKPETNGVTPFSTTYCFANVPVKIQGFDTGVGMGLCLPNTCNDTDVYVLADALVRLFPGGNQIYANFVICKHDPEYDTRGIIAMCVCGFFVGLMIFATVLDVFFVNPEMKRIAAFKKSETNGVNTQTNGVGPMTMAENGASPQHIEVAGPETNGSVQVNNEKKGFPMNNYKIHEYTASASRNTSIQYPGLCTKLILSFSVWTNGKKLLSSEKTGGTLGAINGIRFLSMTWVILGHTYVFAQLLNAYTNAGSFLPKMLKRRSFMAITNALLSVDTFFTLSGLLVAYVFMKEMKREKGRINWFMFYFHRFWRLTPPYMLVMMIDITLFRYLGDGPGWTPNGWEQDFCEDTWWTNLLYVNNFVKFKKMCFAWSWYLANDMQFYVVSPLLLVPLYFSKKIGGAVCAVFLLGVTITTIVVSVDLELPATQYSLIPNPHSGDYFYYYYMRPYCRMGPYIVGIVTGYILYKTRCKCKIPLLVNLFVWAFMTALACLVVYGVYEESTGNHLSVGVAALYNAVHKTLWGVCVSWVIFACVTGNGGFINTLLSWGPFIPLGRLTYCAYLVHPLIMFYNLKSSRVGIYATDIEMIYTFLGNIVLAYLCAFVASLAFESPMMGLEKAIFKRGKKD